MHFPLVVCKCMHSCVCCQCCAHVEKTKPIPFAKRAAGVKAFFFCLDEVLKFAFELLSGGIYSAFINHALPSLVWILSQCTHTHTHTHKQAYLQGQNYLLDRCFPYTFDRGHHIGLIFDDLSFLFLTNLFTVRVPSSPRRWFGWNIYFYLVSRRQ